LIGKWHGESFVKIMLKKVFRRDKSVVKKKSLIIISGLSVLVVVLVVIMVLVITKTSGPETVAKEYCDILVKGNFEEIIDLTYFPKSEFIGEEKLNELKDKYYDRMSKDYSNVVSCTYTETKETEKTITYKITMEKTDGNDTETIEVDKQSNKIMQDNLYRKVKITVHKGATVMVEDKVISIEPKAKTEKNGTNVDVYSLMVLDDVEYNLNITHSIYEYDTEEIGEEGFHYSLNCKLKDDYLENLKEDVNKVCKELVTVVKQKGDIASVNKYFINSDADKLVQENEFLNGTYDNREIDKFNYEFKEVLDTLIEQEIYIEDGQLLLCTRTTYQETVSKKREDQLIIGDGEFIDSYVDGFEVEMKLYWVLDGDEWKISHWE